MTSEEFLQQFGHFVDAPDGVQKLRELVLQLAVQGRLVEQVENDEPVDILLKNIRETKKELVDSGVVKKGKSYPVISEDEIPYIIPGSWRWVRINEIGHNWGQKVPDNNFTYIDVSAINKEAGVIHEPNVLTAKEAPSRARKIVKYGTVIYSTVRPYLLNVAVIENECIPEPIASTAFAIIHPFCGIDARYIYSYLRSPAFIHYVESVQTGIAYPAINDKQFFSGYFPLPPLAEQHRIVAKVDELMALCDQLEAEKKARYETHQRLIRAVHHPLTEASDATATQTAWHRIRDNFSNLYTTLESVHALRQTILQLAVQGKLIQQDPINDESVAELLEESAQQKAQLIKKKTIKKQKVLPAIREEEKPFLLPRGWKWARIGDILSLKHGFAFKSKYFTEIPTSYVLTTPGHFYETGGFRERGGKTKYYSEGVDAEFILEPGDLIIPMTEQAPGLLGSPAFIPNDGNTYIHNQRLGKLTPFSNAVHSEYLYWFFNSSYLRNELASSCSGTTVRHTSPEKVLRVLIPICALSEQKRIVTKVDELMSLCDQLENNIRNKNNTATKYAEAIVQQIAAA
ncbi:MAG: restriction endonuclease subunit S [gamma proteobacterium endosymbiont of Lamellibrachia anaximandri]|nr:restriction endonuclease subunit S [gamma proteobacterium endosymbiont of Lamellibrachia anaximandri]MBL3533677.1 restriction endonuclease subunit S [gamma proteobacterium endosymbiont of Lamellibrachia anaximandri]